MDSLYSTVWQTVIPTGYQCFTAAVLVDLKMRYTAYPFDWMVSPLDAMVTAFDERLRRILPDDIAGSIIPDHRIAPLHNVVNEYGNRLSHLLNPHISIPDQLESARLQMDRRVKRLLTVLDGAEPTLLIGLYQKGIETWFSLELARKLAATIANRYPQLHFQLVYLVHHPTIKALQRLSKNLVVILGHFDPLDETWTYSPFKTLESKNDFCRFLLPIQVRVTGHLEQKNMY